MFWVNTKQLTQHLFLALVPKHQKALLYWSNLYVESQSCRIESGPIHSRLIRGVFIYKNYLKSDLTLFSFWLPTILEDTGRKILNTFAKSSKETRWDSMMSTWPAMSYLLVKKFPMIRSLRGLNSNLNGKFQKSCCLTEPNQKSRHRTNLWLAKFTPLGFLQNPTLKGSLSYSCQVFEIGCRVSGCCHHWTRCRSSTPSSRHGSSRCLNWTTSPYFHNLNLQRKDTICRDSQNNFRLRKIKQSQIACSNS